MKDLVSFDEELSHTNVGIDVLYIDLPILQSDPDNPRLTMVMRRFGWKVIMILRLISIILISSV